MAEADAAVAVVHARLEDSVLLIRRTERADDPWSGHWSLPGGRRDPGDHDLLDTALRELEEECGIRLAREQLEAAWQPMTARRRSPPFLLVAPFLFRLERELAAIPHPREAVEARWIPLAMLRDAGQHCLRAVPGQPPERRFPAIMVNGVPLWGFTYRLLADWLGRHGASEQAGFEAANRVLEFLLSHGLSLEHGWQNGVAGVKGVIPEAAVIAHFCAPGSGMPMVNCLEVRPDTIGVLGLGQEEYLIRASSPG